MQGEDAALLQAGGKHRTEQKGAHSLASVGRGFDRDFAPIPDQVAGHPFHRQQKHTGGGLPGAASLPGGAECLRHRADADAHLGIGFRGGWGER